MKQLLFVVMLTCIVTTLPAQVVFYESFDGIAGPTAGGAGTYTFPAGWRLRNVDNRTPAASVSYVNEAWERREDFSYNVADSCAFSTSWYSPVGGADDWMWTPLIGVLPANCILSWNAVAYDAAYPDGYEVRIMTSVAGPPTGGTGVIGNQVTSSTVLFSTAAENSTWTARSFNLGAYAGQSVYIAFRNTANDKFLLAIDDVKVEVVLNYDAQVTTGNTFEYTKAPKSQALVPLGGTVKNVGQQTLTNVGIAGNVYNSSNAFVFGSSAFSIPSLASGASNAFVLGDFIPPAPGTYTIKYHPFASQADQNTANDTLTRTVLITDSVFARDDGIPTGQLGIGSGDGYLGQSFTITTAAELRSVTVSYAQGYVGKRYALAIWNTTVPGVPNTIIASTDTLLYPDNNALTDTIPIHGGYVNLTPGKYVVTAIEFDSTIALVQTTNVFTTGTGWVKWSAHPAWANIETFGSQFSKSFYLRMNVTINNNTPVITSNGGGAASGVSIAENTSAVTSVTATDADAASTVYYVLNGGADAAKFSINAATGALSFTSPPDFDLPGDADANNTYIVVVRATDGVKNDDQAITVTITNVNEAPVITSNGGGANASFSIAENISAATTVTASDPDAGATLTYTLNGGADAAKFAINSSSGVLSFITAPDFENPTDAGTNNTYIVTVRVSDGSNTADQTITVTVTDINEPPAITSNGGGAAAGVTIGENTTAATTVTATDIDAGTALNYSLSGGADAGKFAINSISGALVFLTAPDFETPLDADANNTYIVIVRVSDGTLTDDQTITVTIGNANDNTPVITSNGGGSTAGVSVVNPQQNVTTVTATDADGSLNTLSYSITGGVDAGDFTINASTGLLSFINPPNVHSPQDADLNNIYLVTVQVSDGTFTDNQAITVTVTGIFPVTLTRFGAWAGSNYNMLEWSTANEAGMEHYEIERSTDGHDFIKIGSVAAKTSTANEYRFADMQFQPVSFYRLKMKGKDGSARYSEVVKLARGGGIASIKTYPNPVRNGSFALQLSNLPKNDYRIELYDAGGRLVMRRMLDHPGGSATIEMKAASSLGKGVYLLAVKGDGVGLTQNIIVE